MAVSEHSQSAVEAAAKSTVSASQRSTAAPTASSVGFEAPQTHGNRSEKVITRPEPRIADAQVIEDPPPVKASLQAKPLQAKPRQSVHCLPMPQPGGSFVCPYCCEQAAPILEKQVSSDGWMVFGILLVCFFPLCWIGLLMREEIPTCSQCGGDWD